MTGDSTLTLDASAAHELTQQMHELTREVSGLRASFGIYGPMIEQQVNGLADVTNRTTKLDSRIGNIEDRMKEDRASSRWLTGQIFVGVAAITAIVQVMLGMLNHK